MREMKNTKRIIQFLVAGMLLLTGCESKIIGGLKDDTPVYKIPSITAHLDATGSPNIQISNLSGFSGKVILDRYFKDQPGPDKVDLVVRKNLANGSAVKVVQADITTFPTTVTVTAAQIQSLFGELKVGDNYDFAPDLYTKDGKFEAFPSRGPGNANSVSGGPEFSSFARFTVR
jgi:hypothetical protein